MQKAANIFASFDSFNVGANTSTMGTLNWTSEPFYYEARVMDTEIPHNLGWNLGPEDLIHIPEHWLLYPEPEKSMHLVLGIFYVFCFLASMIGNGLVLWIFTTSKPLRTASNMFVVNLAICDLMMMLAAPVFFYNSFHYGFALGHIGCQIYAGAGSLSGIGAGMTNAAIAYDRYNTITRPFDGKITRTNAFFMIIFIWVYTIPWTVMPAMEIWGRFVTEGYLTACSFDYLTRTFDNRLFVGIIFTCSYVIPMSMIIYFYSQIVSKVFRHEKALREQAKKMNVESLRANQQENAESAELRIAKAAITISFMFVVSWTPYAVLALIGAFGDQSLLTPGVSMIPALNCKLVACIDPYIYAISHPKFRVMEVGVTHNLGWNVGPEDLIYIPEHWLVYPEPDKSLHLLLGMVYVFFFMASMIGNGLVLWIFITAKPLRTASNMFVVNLAFCDFLMMLKSPVFLYNSFHYGFALGMTGCQIFAGMGSLSGIGAGMTNAAIAYDRYTTITRPFDGKMTRTKAFVMILMIWFYTIPWTVMPVMEIWGRFAPEGFLTACTFDYLTRTFDNRLFVGTIFTFSYVIPMSMIIYFYSQIVSKVFSHEKALREQAKKMNVESLRANQQQNAESAELRIAKAAITICFLFVVSWTPYAVLALIGAFGDQSLLTPGVSMIPALNCKLVACIDPYIYAISHPKFRLELQKRLPWLAIKEKEITDTQSVATGQSAAPPANA